MMSKESHGLFVGRFIRTVWIKCVCHPDKAIIHDQVQVVRLVSTKNIESPEGLNLKLELIRNC